MTRHLIPFFAVLAAFISGFATCRLVDKLTEPNPPAKASGTFNLTP